MRSASALLVESTGFFPKNGNFRSTSRNRFSNHALIASFLGYTYMKLENPLTVRRSHQTLGFPPSHGSVAGLTAAYPFVSSLNYICGRDFFCASFQYCIPLLSPFENVAAMATSAHNWKIVWPRNSIGKRALRPNRKWGREALCIFIGYVYRLMQWPLRDRVGGA